MYKKAENNDDNSAFVLRRTVKYLRATFIGKSLILSIAKISLKVVEHFLVHDGPVLESTRAHTSLTHLHIGMKRILPFSPLAGYLNRQSREARNH